MKHLNERAYRMQGFVMRVSEYFEILLGLIVIVAILIAIAKVPAELFNLHINGGFPNFLKTTFDIIIGVELLRMLCRHDLDSVVEVLLFTVARSIIIEHTTMIENLVGILSIAVLFIIRKYLFIPALDKDEKS